MRVTSDLVGAVFEADIILCVTPSEHMRGVFAQIAPMLTRNQIIVSATKGLEETSLLRMSQVDRLAYQQSLRRPQRPILRRGSRSRYPHRHRRRRLRHHRRPHHPARVQLARRSASTPTTT